MPQERPESPEGLCWWRMWPGSWEDGGQSELCGKEPQGTHRTEKEDFAWMELEELCPTPWGPAPITLNPGSSLLPVLGSLRAFRISPNLTKQLFLVSELSCWRNNNQGKECLPLTPISVSIS